MLQHVRIERVDLGIVNVRRERAFAQVIQHNHASDTAQPAKRCLVQFGPGLRAGAKRQQPDSFPAISQCHHKQPRAPVPAGRRFTHHWASAVVDLSFLVRSSFNHDAGFGCGSPAQFSHEALDAGIASHETVAVHQVLPDCHRVTALCQHGLDELAVGLAGARRGT